MHMNEILQVLLFFGLGILLTPPLGRFMAKVFKGEKTFLHSIFQPIESWIYRLTGVDTKEEMSWLTYFLAVVVFTCVGFASLMGIFMLQIWLPLNPQKFANCSWHLAFMQAWSFTCNADWQSYMGESTMSYFSQTIGIMVHQFLSGAVGISVLVAVGRALKRATVKTIGNFWVDLTRGLLYIVLPLSILWAIPLTWQGVPQTWKSYQTAELVETHAPQSIPVGPVASFVAVKQLFTNGGGWYGVNSAHPFENPTPLANFLELLAIVLIPMAQVYMFGELIGNRRHAWTLFLVMLSLFTLSFGVAWWAEMQPNPVVHNIQPLMEGKEVRFGVMNSMLWATSTTAIDNGSVNAMHDSFMPLAGLMPMWNIMIGEILFGGVGCGLYSMLFHVLITVFIAGLMIGRTPEYLGKKLDAWVATWAAIGILIPNVICLIPSAIACILPTGLASLNNGGPHGLSEILYCYAEAANNNGSAFAGLNANTLWYNTTVGIVILIGRIIPILAILAIAGRLASQKTVEASSGTLPTHGWTFGLTLTGVIAIVAALTFFPALCLGPIIEHGLMLSGRVF